LNFHLMIQQFKIQFNFIVLFFYHMKNFLIRKFPSGIIFFDKDTIDLLVLRK
jgi:hypothetical protein